MTQRKTSVIRQLRAIGAALQSINRSLKQLAPMVDGRRAGRAALPAPAPTRKLKLSPARRDALKLQGQYMGYMRGLKPRQKARVKALAASKNIRAAISLARRLAGS